MRMAQKGRRRALHQSLFHLADIASGRETSAVGNAEDMRIHRDRLFSEGDVQDDIGAFAPDPRQRLQLFARARDFAAEARQQHIRERDHILRLCLIEAYRFDVVAEFVFAEAEHFLRRVGFGEERRRRFIDAFVGRPRREDDRDQKRIGVGVVEFAFGVWIRLFERGVESLDGAWRHQFLGRVFWHSGAGVG